MLTALLAIALAADPVARGGVVAPAALPAGTIAMYAQVGAPDLGVGYRQGFAPFELEARVAFNLLALSGLIDVGLRVPLLTSEKLQLSAGGSLGLLFNSGSRYFDPANFGSVALRPRLLGTLGLPFSDLVTGLVQLEVPLALSMTVVGGAVHADGWRGCRGAPGRKPVTAGDGSDWRRRHQGAAGRHPGAARVGRAPGHRLPTVLSVTRYR